MELVEIWHRGRGAFTEAIEAVKRGKGVAVLHPALTLDEEVSLKRVALERGVLVLGPGCGSSCVEGCGFGIWNSVKKGPVGIVSTGGSGIRELATLLQEIGVSSSICVGYRDLSQKVGGLGTTAALSYLASDSSTEVIVLAALTPSASITRTILNQIKACKKPVVMCFLGSLPRGIPAHRTFEAAAIDVMRILNVEPKLSRVSLQDIAREEHSKLTYGQKYVRGIFCGGMLCVEAQAVLGEWFKPIYSNVPLSPRARLPDPHSSKGHACVDMGDPELSETHPAVNPPSTCERILREARDLEVAVLLLDVVLGNGAHPDPAGELVKAVGEARQKAEETGGYLSVIASIIGTEQDPQGPTYQRKKLEDAGVLLMPSNASASKLSAMVVKPELARQILQP